MRFTIILCLLAITASFKMYAQSSYQYTVDLTNVVDDKIYVELVPPPIIEDEITFYLPKIIPGTYDIADYGRFIVDLKAVDKKGKTLPVERMDDNSWKIKSAKKVSKLSYWVNDTFDSTLTDNEIFWPAGTNIDRNENFVINPSGFFGYFDQKKETPFQITVIRPEQFYGSTGLIPVQAGVTTSSLKLEKSKDASNKRVDVYRTTDYDQLVDSPIMYAEPDTAIIKVANTEVLIGSYAPENSISAKEIAESIREVLMAQKEYLGGTLPVDKYAFIFYFTNQPVMSYGALEHSYSSFYFMPEATIEQMEPQLRDFAAHEFFHIITPLTVHSKEIDNFDFNDPKMSQHLWMYEGVTEYFAGNVQVKYGLISPEEYLMTLQEKMITADQFKDDLPFTELSKFTLDKYHDQYYNVYLKGALIGLCLDLKLKKLSDGKYGLQNLMLDLSKKFGKNKAFEDDKLFDIITEMTYPEIGEFFNRYVKGSESLPLKEVLSYVGIDYSEEEKYEDFSLGLSNENVTVNQHNSKPYLAIANTQSLNEVGKALGFQEGDLLIKINDETVPDLGPKLGEFIARQKDSLEEGKTLSFTVLRKNDLGEMTEKTLSTPVKKIELSQRHVLQFAEAPTPEQMALLTSWLKP